MARFLLKISTLISLLFLTHPIPLVCGECTCEPQFKDQHKHGALPYKIAATASILIASALGVCIPILLKNVKSFQPGEAIHFLIKAFAAGVILATGFIHILPEAFQSLTSCCLHLGSFPFAGLIAMSSCIATLMMEAFATGYHTRAQLRKALPLEIVEDEDSPAIILQRSNSSDLLRHRIVSQVLELGIIVHSVIIGISLGASQSPKTIRPLIAALSFHQFFEGMGLGGCISEAKLKSKAIATMVIFFSVTTPAGIAIGIIISKGYHEDSPSSLIVEGVLNSASAGILIYMALVDLLAPDFINPKLQTNLRLQLGASVTLLAGASCMSLLAHLGT
ncbi:hypothetical protein BUALT_Bualt03G0004800 [Buddleja alternifolia]|uniref:Uncharacterized protein n=1 Tax=Buddleja alternifolia TaxID=168488 RepID=A0AAV6XUD8_9LAMI|nr:hypothetical protein BUALT_Bualt03G0004800 [Buddleja alternifolia]